MIEAVGLTLDYDLELYPEGLAVTHNPGNTVYLHGKLQDEHGYDIAGWCGNMPEEGLHLTQVWIDPAGADYKTPYSEFKDWKSYIGVSYIWRNPHFDRLTGLIVRLGDYESVHDYALNAYKTKTTII